MLIPNLWMMRKKVNKSLLQGNLLSTIEENLQEEDLEVHEDDALRSGGEIERVNEKEKVEEVDEELIKQLKNEEVETVSEMTPWAFMQEEFPSEDIPYILEVEELVASWHEIEEPPLWTKQSNDLKRMCSSY